MNGKPIDKTVSQNNSIEHQDIGGWLILVGIWLIIGLILQVFSFFEYLPLLKQEYNIPGFTGALQFEFIATIIFIAAFFYLIYLFFKKDKKFPPYYILLLITIVAYVILDYNIIASLSAPNQELQQILDMARSKSSSEIGKGVISAIIWISYMIRSKRVIVTFVN